MLSAGGRATEFDRGPTRLPFETKLRIPVYQEGDVKLLLLGQAESGKSTLQKQFQLMYKPSSIDQERISWKTVIYFNVVRSLKHILAVLEAWDDNLDDDSEPSPADDPTSNAQNRPRFNGIAGQPSPMASFLNSSSIASMYSGSPSGTALPAQSPAAESNSAQIGTLSRRLSLLISFDAQLADRLSGGISVSGSGKGGVYVRSGWQARAIENALGRVKPRSTPYDNEIKKTNVPHEVPDVLVEEVARLLATSKNDIKELWGHPTVKGLMNRRKLKLDEWSEFFLKHISRVAAPDYIPTTDDILHARIQTMGVAEHVFDLTIHGKAVSWHLFDVGGARGQRHSWVPYFDDANAIIFVAPVSAFDQVSIFFRRPFFSLVKDFDLF
jgi:hypothetical protein